MCAYITGSGQFLPGEPVSNADMVAYLGRLSDQAERLGRLTLRRNGIIAQYLKRSAGQKDGMK